MIKNFNFDNRYTIRQGNSPTTQFISLSLNIFLLVILSFYNLNKQIFFHHLLLILIQIPQPYFFYIYHNLRYIEWLFDLILQDLYILKVALVSS